MHVCLVFVCSDEEEQLQSEHQNLKRNNQSINQSINDEINCESGLSDFGEFFFAYSIIFKAHFVKKFVIKILRIQQTKSVKTSKFPTLKINLLVPLYGTNCDTLIEKSYTY